MKSYEGYKYCKNCDCIYPIEVYYKDKYAPDGLHTYCKFCMSKIHLDRYYKKQRKKDKNDIERIKWNSYRCNAKRRGLLFNISREYFDKLLYDDCYYCGGFGNPNGIDRIDNSIGYIEGNVVSCCRFCNLMKRDYSLEMFINHIEKIHSHSVIP